MGTILKFYRKILYRYPFTSQAVQTGLLMATGDAIAQTIVEHRPLKDYSIKRTAQFALVGSVFVGPTLTVWYATLQRYFGAGGKSTTIKKVAADQLLFAPICVVVFLTCINAVQGQSLEVTKKHIEENYFDILMTNYKIWPMVQLVNFYVVPLHYQVLFVQAVAIFWNAYLSFKTRPDQ